MTDMGEVKTKLSRVMNHDEEQKGSISILNDFCLLQILNRLDINDLCNVVNVNKQFKKVSEMSFSGRYETFKYPYQLTISLNQLKSQLISQMRRVLCKFGHLIKSLSLKDFDPAGVFIGCRIYPIEMDVISKYCAGTLKELKLDIFLSFECDWAKPLFASLRALKINCSEFKGDASELFNECKELKILKISSSPYTELISEFAQNYPNLEELCISSCLNVQTTFTLLELNPQIKKLDIYDADANKTICVVASKMEKLEELTLRCELNSYDNISELGKLKSLKLLELQDIDSKIVPAIEAFQNLPLECLKWYDGPSNLEFMDSILKLKTLKNLALTTISSPFDNFLRMLGEQLPLLEQLELGFKHQEKPLFSIGDLRILIERSPKLFAIKIHTNHFNLFNQQAYDSLLDVIEKRINKKKFEITIYGNYSNSLQSGLLDMKFIGEDCTCSHCEPLDNYDYNDFQDDFDEDFDEDFDDNNDVWNML